MRCHPIAKVAIILGSTLAISGCDPESDPERSSFELRQGGGSFEPLSFEGNPGALDAYLYVPATVPAGPAPLVVAMHACTQDATAYRAAGWEEIADEMGFLVLYPEQRSGNNAAGCFNWGGEYGDPTNLMRGQGENQSIVSMIEAVKAKHDIDASRIYATGHSGGGAQVALMLATWPDVFAGGGIFAGIPYHCTTSFNQVSSCLSPGIDKTPEEHAGFVLDAYPEFAGPYPRLSIWHGSSDFLVNSMNQTELLEQWGTVHGIDLSPDFTEMVGVAERSEYHDAGGDVLIETYLVQGAGHATFNAPSEGCGAAGSYFEDHGLCGARLIAEFWGLDQAAGGDDSGGGTDGGGDDSAGDSASSASGDGGSADSGESAGDDGSSGGGTGSSGDDGSAGDDGGTVDPQGLPPGEEAEDPVRGVGQCTISPEPLGRLGLLAWLGLALGWLRRRR